MKTRCLEDVLLSVITKQCADQKLVIERMERSLFTQLINKLNIRKENEESEIDTCETYTNRYPLFSASILSVITDGCI